MKHSLSRRGLTFGLAALPLAGAASVASAPSNLAQACDWAIQHRAWLNVAGLDDEGLDREMGRLNAVFSRAIAEPSREPRDLSAKARMLLDDMIEGGHGDEDEHDDVRLTLVILREVIALCA
ncbi:hypothetical protein FV219_01485 [Methylobacterium sp. WL122]|nr:hypothetical protein FV219_01485 [Methylobacterium sp. WL122]